MGPLDPGKQKDCCDFRITNVARLSRQNVGSETLKHGLPRGCLWYAKSPDSTAGLTPANAALSMEILQGKNLLRCLDFRQYWARFVAREHSECP